MPSAKLTSKGQITIPQQVREVLGVQPGDRLAFRVHEDGMVEIVPETVDVHSLFGVIKPKRKGVTTTAMNAAIRKRATKRS